MIRSIIYLVKLVKGVNYESIDMIEEEEIEGGAREMKTRIDTRDHHPRHRILLYQHHALLFYDIRIS